MERTLYVVMIIFIILLIIKAIVTHVKKKVIPFILGSMAGGIGLSKIIPNDGHHKNRGIFVALASIVSGIITEKAVNSYQKKDKEEKDAVALPIPHQSSIKSKPRLPLIRVKRYCSKCGLELHPVYSDKKYDTSTGRPVVHYECPVYTRFLQDYPLIRKKRLFSRIANPTSQQWSDYLHYSTRSDEFELWEDFFMG